MKKLVLMMIGVSAALCVEALERPSFAEFDAKAASGEARLNVVFFGGSFTWGAGASDPQRTSWRGLMMQYLLERYPKGSFAFHDATVGGTGSQLGVFRRIDGFENGREKTAEAKRSLRVLRIDDGDNLHIIVPHTRRCACRPKRVGCRRCR